MAQGRVIVLHTTKKDVDNEWVLLFQYCRYNYGDGREENGYRFIWRKPDGKLQGARGQARIASIADINELTAMAIRAGWGHYIEGNLSYALAT